MRSAIAGLSIGLFGEILPIPAFPRTRAFSGIGLSDWPGYASRLRKALDYRNTFLTRRPKLDITSIDTLPSRQYDFAISIDVFEHVPPSSFKSVPRCRFAAKTRWRVGPLHALSPRRRDPRALSESP